MQMTQTFRDEMEDCNCSNTCSRCFVPTPISSKPGIEMPILHLGLILAIETEGFRQIKYHPRNELLKTYTWPFVWHPDWGERERESLALFAGPQFSQIDPEGHCSPHKEHRFCRKPVGSSWGVSSSAVIRDDTSILTEELSGVWR